MWQKSKERAIRQKEIHIVDDQMEFLNQVPS